MRASSGRWALPRLLALAAAPADGPDLADPAGDHGGDLRGRRHHRHRRAHHRRRASSEILGQQVIIENVGGAGGMTGSARVAKAPPDGYQFVLGNVGTHAQNQTLYKNPLYNAATDFAPVGLLVDLPMVMVARKDLPANNLPEFIAYAKANQAKMQYGSAGAGSPTHLACALLNAAIGVNITHVPYRGSAPALQDLIAGRIDYQCLNAAAAIPQIEGKTAKAITMLTQERSPTLAESADRA